MPPPPPPRADLRPRLSLSLSAPPAAQVWFRSMTDEEYCELALHIFEYLACTADRLAMTERSLVRHAFIGDYDGLAWHHLNPRIFFRLRPVAAILDAYYPCVAQLNLASLGLPWPLLA